MDENERPSQQIETSQGGSPDNDSAPKAHAEPDGEPRAAEPSGTGGGQGQGGSAILAQLQQMIDQVARQTEPVLREVAAKAAELAAVAGERAGPLAQRAAGATQSVGERVAAKGKEVAADLRRASSTSDSPGDGGPTEPPPS